MNIRRGKTHLSQGDRRIFCTINRINYNKSHTHISGNLVVNQKSLGRAGSKCWLGKRPLVIWVVMNPVDHPHGGGKGRAPIGRRKKSTTPWGYPVLRKKK